MKLETKRENGTLRVSLVGGDSLDSHTAAGVKARADALLDDGADAELVIDLTEIRFIDSAGLGALVHLFKLARRRGYRASYSGVQPEVLRVLEMIQLDVIFGLVSRV